MYEIIMARPEDETVPLEGCVERQPSRTGEWLNSLPPAEAMMLFDTLNILPGDFLTKVDRASIDRQSEIWAAVVFQEWLAGTCESPAALSA